MSDTSNPFTQARESWGSEKGPDAAVGPYADGGISRELTLDQGPAPGILDAAKKIGSEAVDIYNDDENGGGILPAIGSVISKAMPKSDLAIDIARAPITMTQTLSGLGNLATGGVLGKVLDTVGFDPKTASEMLSEGYSEERKADQRAVADAAAGMGRQISEASGAGETMAAAGSGAGSLVWSLLTHPSVIQEQIIQTLPDMLFGAGVVGKVGKLVFLGGAKANGIAATRAAELMAGAAPTTAAEMAAIKAGSKAVELASNKLSWLGHGIEGAQAAGQNAWQIRQENPGDLAAQYLQVPAGVITGMIGRAASKIPGFEDVQTAAQMAVAGPKVGSQILGATGGTLARIGKGALSEGLFQELPQSAQEQVWQNIAQGKPWDMDVLSQGIQGGVVGAVLGAGMGGISKPAVKSADPAADAAADLTAPVVEAAGQPNSPLSRAAVAGNPGIDEVSTRVDEIELKVRDAGLLQKIRDISEEYPDLSNRVLSSLAVAKNSTLPAEARRLALSELEDAIDTLAMVPAKKAGAAWQGLGLDTQDGTLQGQQAAAAGGLAAANLAGAQWQENGPAPLQNIEQPMTAVPGAAGLVAGLEAGGEAQGIYRIPGGVEALGETSQLSDKPVARAIAVPPEVVVPVQTAETAAIPSYVRKRKAQLSAMVEAGFDAIEQRDGQSWLVNYESDHEMALEGPSDIARAQAAINAKVNDEAHRSINSPLNDKTPASDAQIAADNYSKPPVTRFGLTFKSENPAGSTRSGKDKGGKSWSITMKHHYTGIEGTKSTDGSLVDAFMGTGHKIFVVDQVDPKTGMHDEPKVMVGFRGEDEARKAYLANYSPGWKGLGAITEMPAQEFRRWVKSSDAQWPVSATIPSSKGERNDRRGAGAAGNTAARLANDPAGEMAGSAAVAAGTASAIPSFLRDEPAADVAGPGQGVGDAREAAVSRLRAHYESTGEDATATLVADDDPRSQSLAPVVAALEKRFGKAPILIESTGKNATDGVQQGEDYFVNIDSPVQNILSTAIHELGHTFENGRDRVEPGPLGALNEMMWARIPASARAAYFKYLSRTGQVEAAAYEKATARDLIVLRSEMLKDFMGQRFADKPWLERLSKEKPAFFRDFVREWIKALDELIEGFKGLLNSRGGRGGMSKDIDHLMRKHLKELEEMKAIAIEVAAEWAKKNPKLAGGADLRTSESARDQTETPEFKKWFGDSKVVDSDGKPLVVYHGIPHQFKGDSFKRAESRVGAQSLGFHFGTAESANDRLAPVQERMQDLPALSEMERLQPSIMPVYLSIKNPLRMSDIGSWHKPAWVNRGLELAGVDAQAPTIAKIKARLQAAGYDGIVYQNEFEGRGKFAGEAEFKADDSYIAFEPNQIKSATGNSGSFDPSVSDISKSDRDLSPEDMSALQDELDAEMSPEAQARLDLEFEQAVEKQLRESIKSKGLMAEAAFPKLAWKASPGTNGAQLVASAPNLFANGKSAALTMDNVGDLWRLDGLRGAWVGPAESEGGAYATKEAAKAFGDRYVAAKELRDMGFDLVSTIDDGAMNGLVDAWSKLEAITDQGTPGARRYAHKFGKPGAEARSLLDIAKSMGVTEGYGVRVTSDPDSAGEIINVFFTNKTTGKEVSAMLDVNKVNGKKKITAHTGSLGKVGLGSALYQMVAEYAARTGATITPDFALSGINTYRRTEQMLSAAMRTGKSNVMVPHPSQRLYGFNDNAATEDQHRANIARMLLAGLRNVYEISPKILTDLIYKPETGKFFDKRGADAEPRVAKALADVNARAFGLGRSTLARAAITQQILEGGIGEVTSFAAPVLYSARDNAALEFAAVEAKYAGTPDMMRAPNGEGTQLTRRQWIQVRTPSFKKWFGDWEAAYAKGGVWANDDVSKVVDKNGEPLVVYHGTDSGGFFKFDDPTGVSRGNLGIFTTDNDDMARTYVRRGRIKELEPDDKVRREALAIEITKGFQYEGAFYEDEDELRSDYDLPRDYEAEPAFSFIVDGYNDGIFDTIEEAEAAADDYINSEPKNIPTVYSLFANIRNPQEENFEGALWSGSREHQNVVVKDGEQQSNDDGTMYFNETDEAEKLAAKIGGEVEPAPDFYQSTDAVVREGRKYGNDGVIIRSVVDDGGGAGRYTYEASDVFVAFRSDQVKSAEWNSGEFDEYSDIRRSGRAGEFEYEVDERGRLVVHGDAARIAFLVKQAGDITSFVEGEDFVRFRGDQAYAVISTLEDAPKVDPSIAKSIGKAFKLTPEEIAATSLKHQTGGTKDRSFVVPLGKGIPDVVSMLEARRRASGLPLLSLDSEADRQTLAKLLAAETAAAIKANKGTSEWYDQTIARTMSMAAVKYPELKNDRHAQMAFRLAVAISSQTQDVESNLAFAVKQYDYFRSNGGKFREVGTGKSEPAMRSNFILANELLADMGPSLLGRFLSTGFTVGEMKSAGFEVNDELIDEQVLGSSVFGPKIGFGFYSNLNGNFEPVTMDMWFMRLIGRLTGWLKGFNPTLFAKQLAEFRESLDAAGDNGLYASSFSPELVEKARTDDEAAIKLARLVESAHERDFKEHREKFDAKTRKKSSLVSKSIGMVKSLDAPKDAPSNGKERRHLRDVVRQAVDMVAKFNGGRIPPAAMQALVWYPEQELYRASGVKLRVTSQDFAGAMENILKKDGVDEKDIKRASDDGARLARQKNAGDVAGAKGSNGEGAWGTRPLDSGARDQFLSERREKFFLSKEQADPSHHRVVFEVAPNPDDAKAVASWAGLGRLEKLRISESIARKTIPGYLESMGASGYILSQDGSYFDDTNPSFVLVLDKGNINEIAKGLGYGLNQREMMLLSPKQFGGSNQSGSVTVDIGPKSIEEVDEIYQKLREIEVGGKKVIMGQSTANGTMIIINDKAGNESSGLAYVSDEELRVLVDEKLGGVYHVASHDVFTRFMDHKEYDNYEQQKSNPRGNAEAVRQRARDLRDEAARRLAAELAAAPRKSSRDEGPDGGSVRQHVVRHAVHYGRQAGLTTLSGSASGTGISGAEQARLSEPGVDPRIKRRVYFYLPVDGGIPQAEIGLGTHVYTARLEGLYDPTKSSPILFGKGPNDFEAKVLDAGYTGYVNHEQGTIVVLNKDVPVEYGGRSYDQKVVPRRIERIVQKAFTRVEGDELVRKPSQEELGSAVKNKAAIQAVAPSYRLANGEVRIKAVEAEAADGVLAAAGAPFRFGVKAAKEAAPEEVRASSRYEGKKVVVQVKIEDTGQVASLTMDIDKSLADYEKRLANMLDLLRCLK